MIGLWLVLTFKSSPLRRADSGARAAISTTTTTDLSAPPDSGGQPPAGAAPPGTDTATTPATTTTAPSTAGQRTITGDTVSTQFGDVQVAVVFEGTRIVDVKPLQLPFDRPHSQAISNVAAPLLHDEVVQAQSAQIDTISDATYTSEAYAESVQSALDRARG
jgi:uncharacterized protein with FMN-binding domain